MIILRLLTENRRAYIERRHGAYEKERSSNIVDLIMGFARFTGPHSIEVNGEQLTADHIVLAAGGRPSVPDIPGAEWVSTLTDFLPSGACRRVSPSSVRAISPLK